MDPAMPRPTAKMTTQSSNSARDGLSVSCAIGLTGVLLSQISEHTLATLARWCRIRSYLDSAANHGLGILDAIRAALAGKPWLPPLPALA